MKQNNVLDFGQAVRALAADRGSQELGGVRPATRMSTAQEDAELERAIKERGYDV
jgi:hypothetical protein